MEAVIIFGALILLVLIVVGFASVKNDDPRDHVTGRWGVKTGKFVSGNWGGEKWGEKPKKSP